MNQCTTFSPSPAKRHPCRYVALAIFAMLWVFGADSAAGLNLVGQFSPIEGQVSFVTFSEDYVFYAPDTYLHVFHKDLTNTLFFKLSIMDIPERRGSVMARQYGDRIYLSAYGYDPSPGVMSGSITVVNIADTDNIYFEYTYIAGEPANPISFGPFQRRGDILYMINQGEGFCTVDISEMGNFQMMDRMLFELRKPWDTTVRPRCVEFTYNRVISV